MQRKARFALLVAVALVAAATVAISPTTGRADPCPEVADGDWTGTAEFAGGGGTVDLEINWTIDELGVLSGTLFTNGDGPYTLTGSVECNLITVGAASIGATFDGTFAPDGRSVTGTFGGVAFGTWSATADAGAYELTTTSTAQPTTIGAGAATSWHIDVENTGGAPAIAVKVDFFVSGSGALAPLSQTSVTQGSGCVADTEDPLHYRCEIGTLAPGQTASAQVVVVSNGGAGTQIFLDGYAESPFGGGTDAFASTVVVSVVGPAQLPPGSASGVARPGVTFSTPGTPTPANPIVVKFKLPKKVAAGTVSASARAAKVPAPPVPMSISLVGAEAATFCGGAACSGSVIHLTAFAGYNDPKAPAKVMITWDGSVRGRGAASTIYKRGDSKSSPLRTLSNCVKAKKIGYVNLPCVSKRKQMKNGDVRFLLLMLSGDPKFARR